MTQTGSLLERLRQPEYTGENRCLPCTVVNTIIAAVAAVGVGAAGGMVATPVVGLAAAVGVFALSVSLIYLRGYLVPKTPELTKRYFPEWLLALFGKDEQVRIETDVDPETALSGAGALEDCEDEDDLCLTEEFRESWYDEIDRLQSADAGRESLFELFAVEAGEVEFVEHGEAFEARVDGTLVGQWESNGAFYADLGGASALAGRVENWIELDPMERSQLVSGLRIFIDRCPSCGGVPSLRTDTVESCCSTHEVAAVACQHCETRLFESRL